MHRSFNRIIVAVSAIALSALCARAEIRYTVTKLDAIDPNDTRNSAPFGLNNLGQVVGQFGSFGNLHAFLWSNGTFTDLGTLGGKQSWARGINDLGQIVGGSEPTLGSSQTHAFLYANGVMTDLDAARPTDSSTASAINNAGQIAAIASAPGPSSHAFLYTTAGSRTDLGSFGMTDSQAFAINELGQVAGVATDDNSTATKGFIRNPDGSFIPLGLPGSYTVGINDAAQAVGYVPFPGPGFIYANGQTVELQNTAGPNSRAFDINNLGQVVGAGPSGATLYDLAGQPTDLNALIDPSLGWTLAEARAINDHGQIVVTAFKGLGSPQKALLLTPIPEPSLLACCAFILAIPRRRHRLVQR